MAENTTSSATTSTPVVEAPKTTSGFLKLGSSSRRSSAKAAKQQQQKQASDGNESNNGTASAATGGEQSASSSNYKQILKRAINNLNPIKRSSQTSSGSNGGNESTSKNSTLKPLKSSSSNKKQQQQPTENKLILGNDDRHGQKCTFEQLRSFNKQNASVLSANKEAAAAAVVSAASTSSNPTASAIVTSTPLAPKPPTQVPVVSPAVPKSLSCSAVNKSAGNSKKNGELVDSNENTNGVVVVENGGNVGMSASSGSGTKSARSSFKHKSAKLYRGLEKRFSFKNKSDNNKKSPGGRTKSKIELAAGYGFNEDQIGVFEETFQIFDKDCDGFITLVEIRTVMNALGFFPCDDIIRKSIQNIDSDNSGTVDFEEFICMMSKFRKIKTTSELDDELLEIFQIFDRNQDGFIDKEELKDVLLRLGENITDDEVAEMIKEADTDGDNKVSFTEFRSILHDNRTLAKT